MLTCITDPGLGPLLANLAEDGPLPPVPAAFGLAVSELLAFTAFARAG